MTLCDTGPLVALIDISDKYHKACASLLPTLPGPLLTTWPCLTEAMYLVEQYGGQQDQEKLWSLVEQGTVVLHPISEAERVRMHELMTQYRDTPMDFADASLVAVAETLRLTHIFTTDSDFYFYQMQGKTPFTVVP